MVRSVAVCLFSGGIDSSTSAWLCRNRGDAVYLLSINYGQVMQRELDSAAALAERLAPREHRIVEIHGFRDISASARTDAARIEYDRRGALSEGYVPSAYPPGRDFAFISLGVAWAETLVLEAPERYGAARVVIGTNRTDSLDYPDCQAETYELFTELLKSSLKMTRVLGKTIEVEAPLINMTKAEVVGLALRLGLPLDLTWSCYRGDKLACGRCDACRIRYFAFLEAGLRDPLDYEPAEIAPLVDFASPLAARAAGRALSGRVSINDEPLNARSSV